MLRMICALAVGLACSSAYAENRIDTVRPDAPELAAYGENKVGVRTIELTNPGQPDIASVDPKVEKPDPVPTVDRKLTVEVFYPAAADATGSNVMEAAIRNGDMVELVGRSMRDAAPAKGTFPLVLLSHGYPGNRFLMSHLAENLASKGYVVASIDHPASTYRDQRAFGDTLVNRPLDQVFVLDEMARLAGDDGSFLDGLVDVSNTGLIGYSMGGYGAMIVGGAGVTDDGIAIPFGTPHGLLAVHKHGSDTQMKPDERIKSIVAFGPWGRNWNFWSADTMKGLSIPTLFIAGGVDDVSGYEKGVRLLFEEATGVDRALLTYENANHNAGAPMPAPAEAIAAGAANADGLAPYDHYADAVWDNVRMNNIAQHFVTAWLDQYLKGSNEAGTYLDLVPVANEAVFKMGDDGKPAPEHNHWKGFAARTAKGLRFERRAKGE